MVCLTVERAEPTGHMLAYGTSKPGSLVDLNTWTQLYPTRCGIGGGVVAWNPCWDQARRGVLHGGANPGVGNLGSGFSILLKGCRMQLTGSCTWRVPSYLLQDVNRFESPQFSDMNAVWSRLNIVTNCDATSIKVVACDPRVIMMTMN